MGLTNGVRMTLYRANLRIISVRGAVLTGERLPPASRCLAWWRILSINRTCESSGEELAWCQASHMSYWLSIAVSGVNCDENGRKTKLASSRGTVLKAFASFKQPYSPIGPVRLSRRCQDCSKEAKEGKLAAAVGDFNVALSACTAQGQTASADLRAMGSYLMVAWPRAVWKAKRLAILLKSSLTVERLTHLRFCRPAETLPTP